MTLQAGYWFAVAPHCHVPVEWPSRLLLGPGVVEAGGRFFPIPSWRPPTPDELALLLPASDGALSSQDAEASVCLFQLPVHLQAAWWNLVEQAVEVLGGGRLPGFEAFVSRVLEFLVFKDLAAPAGARCSVVVNQPRQQSANAEPGAPGPAGLRSSLAAETPWLVDHELGWTGLWGAINLGDEDVSIVLINLRYGQIDAELRRRLPEQASPASAGDLVTRFLRLCPDYPTIRLILKPGEGYRLPRRGLILDGYSRDKHEAEMLLMISGEGGRE
jgi:hypothetical protein